jgi:hypothetical protein
MHLSGRYFNGNIGVVKNGNVIGTETAAPTPLRNAARTLNYLGKSNWIADSLLSANMDEFRVMKKYPINYRFSDYNSQNSPNTYWGVSSDILFAYVNVQYSDVKDVFWSTSS